MANSRTDPQSTPPTLLTLPLELRHLIYSHTLTPLLILPSRPRLTHIHNTYRHASNAYQHPSPSNPLIHNILKPSKFNRQPSWRVPAAAYPTSVRSNVYTVSYESKALPCTLQRTCRQLNAEVTRYALKAGIWTFGFRGFEALVKWLRGRDGRERFAVGREEWLGWVGSVVVEMDLDVLLRRGTGEDGDGFHGDEEVDGVPEDQEPWFDALLLLSRLCPQIHTLGLHVELKGPEIQVMHFGLPPVSRLASTSGTAAGSAHADTAATGPLNRPPQDWPPGQKQLRVDFKPTVDRLLTIAESLKGLRRCGIMLEAGHILRNVVADSGDGMGWARSWEQAQLNEELEGRIVALERGLVDLNANMIGLGSKKGSFEADHGVTNVREARLRMLAERGRDQFWY